MKLNKQFFILIASIIIFQFSFFGLKYFVTMDDNNQLGVYHLGSNNIYENVIKPNKLYNVRPLAFFTDAYVFSWFWDNMYALLLIILIMHVCNIYFIYKICEKIDIKLNAFCLILFALAPILVEALYWISASTRIVFSMFLCLFSIYLLLQSIDEEKTVNKIINFLSSICLNLICVGYYEQTIALNLFLFVFVVVCIKKYKYIFIPLLSTMWIGIWYVYFMMKGEMQARGNLNLAGILGNAKDCVIMIYNNLKGAFSNIFPSFNMGLDVVLNSVFSVILLGLIVYTIFYIYKNKCLKDENKKIFRKLVLGIILFIAPFLPFLILNESFIAMRNMYLSFLGLAIIIEVILDLILKLVKNENVCNIIKTVICSLLILVFTISNIDRTNNYKKVNELDNKVLNQILVNVDEDDFDNYKSLSINYNVEELEKYKNLSNYVLSVIESDWATIGKIQVTRKNLNVGKIYINSKQNEADYVFYFDENMQISK